MKTEKKSKKPKENEKIFNLDLGIFQKANSEDWERYEGLLVVFGQYLCQNIYGIHAGRETALFELKENDVYRVNYWYCLESAKDEVCKKLESLVKNFSLQEVTEIKIGEGLEDRAKSVIKSIKEEKFSWVYYRTKNKKTIKK